MESKNVKKRTLKYKLPDDLIVQKDELLMYRENKLIYFALMSKGKNRCNIISEGRMCSYRPYNNNDKNNEAYKVIIDYSMYKRFTAHLARDIYSGDKHTNFMLTEEQKKDFQGDRIKVSELLQIQNDLNKDELKRQAEIEKIREGYGF